MDIKTLFGLTVVPGSILGGIIVATLSKKLRDLFFLALVCTCPLIEKLDVNFVSRDWYRGTSRGFEVAILDVLAISVLVGSVLAPRRGNTRVYWPASLGVMLVFVLYATCNVLTSDPMLFGLFELFRIFRGVILTLAVAFYLRGERELRLMALGVALFLWFECLLALKQRYIDGIHRVPATLIESNSFSVLLCTTAPLMLGAATADFPRWLRLFCGGVLPFIAVAEVMTISRAGVTILALVLFLTAVFTVRFQINARSIALTLLVVLGTAGIVAKSWKTLGERFHESTLKEEYENKTNMGRGYYLRVAEEIAVNDFFGVGLNNWSYWVSNRYGPKLGYRFVPYRGTDHEPSDVVPPTSNVDEAQAAPAHNLCALTLGELGIPGLALFLLVWLRWFQMAGSFLRPKDPAPLRRMGVAIFFGFCGMFLQNLTEWVFRHLPLYYTFHVMLGTLMGLYHIRRKARRVEQEALEIQPGSASALAPAI
jgi:hypothetical protein